MPPVNKLTHVTWPRRTSPTLRLLCSYVEPNKDPEEQNLRPPWIPGLMQELCKNKFEVWMGPTGDETGGAVERGTNEEFGDV